MLSTSELTRYSRHLLLPEVGLEGQRKLKAARIVIVGAGGLGSPAALYLAAAGIGTIGLVDFDAVEYSNLQRQVLHGSPDVGRSKLASARDRLDALNPEITIETHEAVLSIDNALTLLDAYDVIIDGSDNFPTRYLVNDACVMLGKPYAYGSVFRFEGQASVFATRTGPCYRCLHPEPPPLGLIPSCAEGGVLGVLPGIIGTIQATEAIKLVLGVGEPLVGRLLIYDALRMRMREIPLRKDPECPVCGSEPTITSLAAYDQACDSASPQSRPVENATPMPPIPEITVEDLKALTDRGADFTLLDVREPHELNICYLPDAISIPMGQIPNRVNELDPDKDLVVFCKVGGRSARVVAYLQQQGFNRAVNLRGGILEWIDKIDPTQAKY